MSRRGIVARELSESEIFDYVVQIEKFSGRFVVNAGKNIITVEPDPQFRAFMIAHGAKPIEPVVLKPGGSAWINNNFIIPKTNDGRRAWLYELYDHRDVAILKKKIREGKIRHD